MIRRTRFAVGWCALVAAIALTIGPRSPEVASAAPSCTGSKITGTGSTLQGIAQQSVWGPGIASACGISGLVTYNSTGSGAGLNAWNFNGTTSTDTSVGFVASDEAPNAAQLGNAETSAGGARALVIPVAQTAIAVVVNPPSGCEVDRITNKQLENAFKGNVKTWNKFDSASGESCTGAPVTRIVRPTGSGTTYQLKNYLFGANTAILACTEAPGKTWKDLELIGSEEKPNTVWPVNGVGGCKANELSAIKTSSETAGLGSGGADLVKKVNITEGSIGYAALPDIEANRGIGGEFANPNGDTHWLKLQNNGLVKFSEATFADPLEGWNNGANCSSTAYVVPGAGQRGKGSGQSVDWSQVFGGDRNISKDSGNNEAYALCGLTYDLALDGYSKKAGFTSGQAETTKDYLTEYVTASTGQAALTSSEKWYAALPEGGKTENDVHSAAQFAASMIAFTYVPSAPIFTSTVPVSPGNTVTPMAKGSADSGSTVKLYANSACSGGPIGTGSAANFASSGIVATVAENSTSTLSATATIGEQVSACSASSITYVEDSAPPAAPTLSSSNPISPANNNSPSIKGSTESGATVKLYTTATCTGSPVATGWWEFFTFSGLAVAVADNSTTSFHATATDLAGNTSACSTSSLTYEEKSTGVLLESSFEEGLKGWNTSGVGEATPTVISTDARTGTHSAEFKLEGSQNRSELILGGSGTESGAETKKFKEGEGFYYAFSFKIVKEKMLYGHPGAHNLFMQFKSEEVPATEEEQKAGKNSPRFGLQLWNVEGKKGLWTGGKSQEVEGKGERFLAAVSEGEWHDVVIHLVASEKGEGLYQLYLDGTKVDEQKNVTTMVPESKAAYIKNGLYRNGGELTGASEILIDSARLGETLASVGGLGHP